MLAGGLQESSTLSIVQAPIVLVTSSSPKVGNKKSLICTHCNKMLHAQKTCFKLKGCPEWF